jgi:5-oxopent-3-ene-1,2,5-tricarboxylate decarboxylase/2-hydroxyhepta-2,4-diene-1,7-dioate isomerase
MSAPPYKAPPVAPVLYIKTANTFTPTGGTVPLPRGVTALDAAATVGLVMGADGQAAEWALLIDYSVPHTSFFRPPVRSRCADGLLGLGPQLRPMSGWADPLAFDIRVSVNSQEKAVVRLDQLVRPPQALMEDVTAFMTLAPGDVLMLGTSAHAVRVQAGDRVEARCDGFAPTWQRIGAAS